MLPEMDERTYLALKQDIEKNYQNERIAMWGGYIIDGRARLRACRELGREPSVFDIGKQNPVDYILSYNVHRRHLTTVQISLMANKAREILSDQTFFSVFDGIVIPWIDKAVKVSEEDERIANTLFAYASKELMEMIDSNRVTARDAMDIVLTLQKSQQLDAFEPGGVQVDEGQRKRIGLRDRTKFIKNVLESLNDDEVLLVEQWLADRKVNQ